MKAIQLNSSAPSKQSIIRKDRTLSPMPRNLDKQPSVEKPDRKNTINKRKTKIFDPKNWVYFEVLGEGGYGVVRRCREV